MGKFFIVSALVSAFCAQAMNPIAECITQDGESAGASLYTDNNQFVLEVGTATERLDEYRTNAGAVTPRQLDVLSIINNLTRGEEQSIFLTKDISAEHNGIISDAAMITLSIHPFQSSLPNASVARRSQLIVLSCNIPAK